MKSAKPILLIAGATLLLVTCLGRQPLARSLLTHALDARHEWQLDRAERMARWAASLGLPEARVEIAETLLLKGEIRRAHALLETLHHDSGGDSRTAALLGMARFQSNDAPGSIQAFERAAEAARSQNDDVLEARARVGLSRVLYHTQGRSDAARGHLEHALAVARRTSDLKLEADATRHLGVIRLWFDGDSESARKDFFEPALEIYRRSGDRHGEAATLGSIGLGERIAGRLTRYYELQKTAMEIATEIGDRAGQAQSLAALGSLHVSTQNYRKAREYLERSLTLTREIGHVIGENDAGDQLAGVLIKLDEVEDARALLTALIEKNRKNPLLAKYEIASLGDCYLRIGDYANALETIRDSLRLDSEIGQPDHRFTFSMRILESEALTGLNRLTESKEAFEAAMAVGPAIELNWGDSLHPSVSRAELLAALGDYDSAIEQLERAVHDDLSNLSSSRFAELEDERVYDRLFRFLLDTDPENEAAIALAWRFLEQLRYRSYQSVIIGTESSDREATARVRELTRALLRQERSSEGSIVAYAELENQLLRASYRSPGVGRGTGPPIQITLQSLQHALEADLGIIEYVMVRDRAWGVFVSRDAVVSRALPAEPEAISAKISLLRSLLASEAQSARWRPVARDLHRILLEPFAIPPDLDRLVVVPYAFLRDVPFAALVDDDGFLVERHVISTATNASQLMSRSPVTGPGGRGLSVGLSNLGRSGLPGLPAAEDEARSVGALAGGEILSGTDATEAALKRYHGLIPFLHVATHAVIEPDMPLLGRLELGDDALEDGSFTVPEVLELGLRADLVSLSACRTSESHSASGRPMSEVDRIGLLDAFLLAGSRTIVASLLPVSDRASAVLMNSFYENLRRMPRGAALAEAQREMIAGTDLSHPRYWASFVLIGDDR